MLNYPARIVRDGAGYMVSFPDLPEALTSGDTREEAIAMAADALTTAMDFYFEDRRPVPSPSEAKRGQVLIPLPASVSAKVLLLNEMLRQDVRPAQEVNRITTLSHPTKIDTISAALAAMGKRLELKVT